MKRTTLKDTFAGILLGCVMIMFGTGATCAHTTGTVVKDCSNEAAQGLMDDVASALVMDDWRGGLADLVGKFGVCVVKKVVAEIANKSGARAQLDELEAKKAQRARTWLEENTGPTSMRLGPERDHLQALREATDEVVVMPGAVLWAI